MQLTRRLRRNRAHPAIRALVEETHLLPSQLIQPLFIIDGDDRREPISSLPGIDRMTPDLIVKEVRYLAEMGMKAVALFPVLDRRLKDSQGSEALNPNSLVYETLKRIKDSCPEVALIVDIALDPYTDHGHDGVVNLQGNVLNDETVEILSQMALIASQSGADIVAPSDMMDGRVGAIRRSLDEAGHINTAILAYAAKYASSLYGPFREAVQVKLQHGDKKSYQLNPANFREALLECQLDEEEGADMLMVKPALAYLDIIAKVRASSNLPLAAYHVSGEYSMVMAAHEKGWIDGPKVMMEHLLSIKRAGADIILSYASKDLLSLL